MGPSSDAELNGLKQAEAAMRRERDELRAQLEATQADLAALVEKMPLTADAQHAYESGLMTRAEEAEAQVALLREQVLSIKEHGVVVNDRALEAALAATASCPAFSDGQHKRWHDEGPEDLCKCGRVMP